MNTPEVLQGFVGPRLRALREARGWTQQELASRVGLTSKYISESERGLRDLPLSTLRRIVEDGLETPIVEVFPPVRGGRSEATAARNRSTLALHEMSRADQQVLEPLLQLINSSRGAVPPSVESCSPSIAVLR